MIAIVNDLYSNRGIELNCLEVSTAHVHRDGFEVCPTGAFDLCEKGPETFSVSSLGGVDDLAGLQINDVSQIPLPFLNFNLAAMAALVICLAISTT
jgi:hypothetical protein